MKGVGIALISLIGASMGAPGWLDNSYEDMMQSFGQIQPNFQKMDTILGDVSRSFSHEFDQFGNQVQEMGDYWGDHLETVGNQMESRFKKFGNEMQNQVSDVQSQMGSFGNQMENVFNKQFGNIDRQFTHINNQMNSHIGGLSSNFDEMGTNLLGQFDRSFGHSFDDVFGMFGKSRTPWWQKENVCIKREVLEEDDEETKNVNIEVSGNSNFHMQINQCIEKTDSYECLKTIADDGTVKTLKMSHSCCHGYRNINGEGCISMDIKPMEETIADLEAVEFLELMVDNDLDFLLNDNITIFVPTDDAVRDMDLELEEMFVGHDSENVVYNIDDGLVMGREKRSIPQSEDNTVQLILKGHVINGFHNLHSLVESELVETVNQGKDKIRVSIYPTKPQPTVMANCAKVISRNNHATNGIVHVVDKVIVPAEGTIADVLSADEHFKTMMDALEANDLGEMLSQPGHFTIFVPTDEAFEKLNGKTRDRILGNGGCSADLIKSHILSEVVCSGVVDSQVVVTNLAGQDMSLTRDQDGSIEIDGVKLFMKDKMTTNGVIHVIDDVIIQQSVKSVLEHLKEKKADNMIALIEKADLTESIENLKDLTLFLPSEKAILEIPKEIRDELVKDKSKLQDILLHHVASKDQGTCKLKDNLHLDTLGGNSLRVNLHKHFGHRQSLGMVQCARIIESDNKVCGGRVHTIDRVLTPPRGNVMETLEADHPKFAELVRRAKMDADLAQGLKTVLAPVDNAFDKIEADIDDDDVVQAIVQNHIIQSPLCCASVLRSSGFLHELRVRSNLGDALSFHRSNGGHIYANQAAIVRCDQAASNGVVHSIDSLILPRNMGQKKKRSFWVF